MDESENKTETALHRTRLHYLDHKNFAKEIMRKPTRQAAPRLGFQKQTVLHDVQGFAKVCKNEILPSSQPTN